MLEEIKKRKRKSVIASILLFVVILIGGTIAYFSSSISFENLFRTGTYKTITKEVFTSPTNWQPCDFVPKTITTKNEGTVPAAVRIKLTEKWYDDNDNDITSSVPSDSVIINFDNIEEWDKDGDYYYYYTLLNEGESTSSLISGVTLSCDVNGVSCSETSSSEYTCESNSPIAGKKYKLTATVQTAQGNKYQEAWNTNYEVYQEEVIPDKVACDLEVGEEESKEVYYIDSASDLYAFSKSVNSGNSYSGKIVRVRNNIDMSKYTVEQIQNECNDDTITGFTPIGSWNSVPFSGTFEGGGKIISNLTINNPTSGYQGLFGYLRYATVYGLNLENINITANDHAGALAGAEVASNISEIVVDKVNISSGSSAGGLIGMATGDYPTSSYVNSILIKGGESTGKIAIGEQGAYVTTQSIIAENMSGTSLENVSAYSSTVKINGEAQSSGFPESDIGDINFYESLGMDTYIAGDNNDTTYVFDYSPRGSVQITSYKPTTTLSGSGTSEDPYLITSEKDWKQATTDLSRYYKVTKDLDFSKKKFYMLGSGSHPFTGSLDGGAKFINNVTINANQGNNIGLIGYMRDKAKVFGINAINFNIHGNSYVGGILGENFAGAYVYEICMDNVNVTGNSKTGTVVGAYTGDYPFSSPINNILLKNGTTNGHVYLGNPGTYINPSNIIVERIKSSGTYEGTDYYGMDSAPRYSNEVIKNNVQVTNGFDSSLIDDLEYYSDVVETAYNGDSNDSGYYYDYVYSRGKVYLVDKNDTTNVPPYTPTSDSDNTSSSNNCTITYGEWTNLCSKYISGMHGGYQYRQYTGSDQGVGGACTGTGLDAAQRRKVNYICN